MKRPALLPSLILAIVGMALAQPGAGGAQEQEPEMTLPGGGIRYPGGYDPNTVGVVEGRVSSFNHPERGPVSFRLEASGETYIVLAAPSWYWEELEIAIRDGDLVRLKGSKSLGADGNLYLVAREIAVAGREEPIVLRHAGGKPRWSGCGPKGCGKRGR